MKKASILGFALAWACSAAVADSTQAPKPGPQATRPVPSRPEPTPPSDPKASAAVATALDRALSEGWCFLRIEAECQTDGGLASVQLFGNGIGIWKETAQFRLGAATLRTLLEALRDGGFPGLQASYGGKGDPLRPGNQAPRVTCRIGVEVDGVRKQVIQLQGGRQSEALKTLAHRILEEARPAAATGIGAVDLNDGLRKTQAGALAPEAFHLVVHRTGQDSVPRGGPGENWLLHVDGRRASLRRPSSDPGSDAPLVLELGAEDLGRLAGQLAAAALSELPANLYADRYTDVTVAVLNHRKNVQARRFAGLRATTHGEKQKRFDRLLEQLEDLKRRVSEAGQKPAPSVASPASGSARTE